MLMSHTLSSVASRRRGMTSISRTRIGCDESSQRTSPVAPIDVLIFEVALRAGAATRPGDAREDGRELGAVRS
jgi:hypothetical protein